MHRLLFIVAVLFSVSVQASVPGSTKTVTISEETVVETALAPLVETVETTAATTPVVISKVQNQFTFSDGNVIKKNGSGTPDTTPTSVLIKNVGSNGNNITVQYTDNNYNGINLDGVKEAHEDGWTGKGVNIVVLEPGASIHGDTTSGIAKLIAPSATFWTALNDGTDGDYIASTSSEWLDSNDDIVSNSYGRHRNERPVICSGIALGTSCYFGDWTWGTDVDTYASANVTALEARLEAANNALHIYSAGNNGKVTTHGTVFLLNSGPHAYDNSGCETATHGDVTRYTADTCTDIKWMYDEDVDMSRLIWVGAVDSNNKLTSYSVAAGDNAKHDFIVADGDNPFSSGAGTSYAAPRVAGAAALVKHKFETNAINTKKILLETADDLGATGVDSVYGHGRLNLNAAMSPIGELN